MTDQNQPKPPSGVANENIEKPLETLLVASNPSSPTIQFARETLTVRENSDRNASIGSTQSEGIKDTNNSGPLDTRSTSENISHHEGIYWRSPISMVSFFLFGILAS